MLQPSYFTFLNLNLKIIEGWHAFTILSSRKRNDKTVKTGTSTETQFLIKDLNTLRDTKAFIFYGGFYMRFQVVGGIETTNRSTKLRTNSQNLK